MQGLIGAVLGAFIGAIFTYFFNRENEKKNNSYYLEREYINSVCVKIVQYLEERNRDDSLSRSDFEEIVKFIEQIYKENYLIVGEEDKTVLKEISINLNGDLNTLIQNYAVLKKYFSNKIIAYQERVGGVPQKRKSIFFQLKYMLLLIFGIINFIVLTVCGVCGLCGVNSYYIKFYDKYDNIFYSIWMSFTYNIEPFMFLVVGIIWGIISYFLYKKYNKL